MIVKRILHFYSKLVKRVLHFWVKSVKCILHFMGANLRKKTDKTKCFVSFLIGWMNKTGKTWKICVPQISQMDTDFFTSLMNLLLPCGQKSLRKSFWKSMEPMAQKWIIINSYLWKGHELSWIDHECFINSKWSVCGNMC